MLERISSASAALDGAYAGLPDVSSLVREVGQMAPERRPWAVLQQAQRLSLAALHDPLPVLLPLAGQTGAVLVAAGAWLA